MPPLPGLDGVRLSRRVYEADRGAEHHANDSEDYQLVLPTSRGRLWLRREHDVLHDGAVRPGMVRVVAPGERSAMGVRARFDSVVVHLPASTLRAAADHLGAPVSGGRTLPAVAAARPDVRRLGLSFTAALGTSGRHRDLLLQGLATALLALVVDTGQAVPAPAAGLDDTQWAAAVAFADAALTSGVDVPAWAAAVGLPAHEFARRFRARAGTAPYAWFLDRRVDEAGRLLLHTDASIVEVALAAGFNSQSHFTDAFRNRVGATPGRWRAQHLRRAAQPAGPSLSRSASSRITS